VVLERLQKLLARTGLASRRKCEQVIVDGRVTVDGKVVTKLGISVDPRKQEVRCDGVLLKPQTLVYILLYQPRGFVTSARPAGGERSVPELVPDFSQRLFPAGRLDKDSEGLLILTNDGALTARLTHPRFRMTKTYRVTVSGRLTDAQLKNLTAPEWTSKGKMRIPEVKVVKRGARRSELEIVLREGRNREIRRTLAAKGIKVRRLIRTAIGPVTAQGLAPGQYRRLTRDEVKTLRGK
jgi:23S rRNA pseudouridine2605 synthase